MFYNISLILKEKKYIVKNITHYISIWHSKLPNNIIQHNYVTIYYQLECLSVNFGTNSSDRCLYPHYGYYCQNVCDVPSQIVTMYLDAKERLKHQQVHGQSIFQAGTIINIRQK